MFETFGVGLTLPQLGHHVTRDAVRGFCQRAEALGFASLWAQEHLFFALEPSAPYAARPGMPVPDAYRSTMSPLELLSAAAAWTERVVLGTGILVGGYHRPVELAQRVATLDHLSGGRVVVGLSVGWSKDEHDQMDVEFTTRGRRMDELVRALRACWGPDPVQFEGEFFSIPPSIVSPNRGSQAGPPLLSGMRSPAGLRRTAEMFDVWNPASGSIEQIMATAAEIDTLATVTSAAHPGRPTDLHRAAVRRRGPATHDGRPDGGSGSRRPQLPAWPTSSSTRASRPRSPTPTSGSPSPTGSLRCSTPRRSDQPG